MKLKKVSIKNFRNILDAETTIQSDVTCLVGKNESGKTAFLHALDRLNPERTEATFDIQNHYPSWLEKAHRQRGDDLAEFVPITATFDLDDGDKQAVTERFGSKAIEGKTVVAKRTYDNRLMLDVAVDEKAAVRHLLATLTLPDGSEVSNAESFSDATEKIGQEQELQKELEDQEDYEKLETAKQVLGLNGKTFTEHVEGLLKDRIPGFLYFDNYSTLPYTVKIKRIFDESADLAPGEITARSLLRLGTADKEFLLNPNYERRKRELQNTANSLRRDVLEYWTTNDRLRVDPDITTETVTNDQGKSTVFDELKLMIYDERHSLSLPFKEHSTGFQWFFSFLAAFSEYEHRQQPIIILLDEPALGLHARAQKDFLRFINERLAKSGRQVLYTTHSPFMVEPGGLERARVVEDKGVEEGATVSTDVLTTDPDTLFPLQAALGYDLAQHLFIGEHNLVVEGTSDYTYLDVLSDFLTEQGREGRDERWSVVPVGGADMIPTFVALLGLHLDITVIVDAKKRGHQKLNRMMKEGYIASKRVVTIGKILDRTDADIEDLFTVEDYLKLYNDAFGSKVKASDLSGTDPIVKQIARHKGVDDFDHGKPADALLRKRDDFLPKLSDDTLANFEQLFRTVNATLQSSN